MNLSRILAVLLALALTAVARADYLFTYFTKNGEDGLHLAASSDGYTWEGLNDGRSYLEPKVGKSKLMRDPCVVRGPDGMFHLVWTSGWNENNLGYASTRDFITWSEQKEVPVMAHEPGVRNTWAPEIAWDAKRKEFLIYWASTVPGKFTETAGSSESEYNHRMYFTTTRDFQAFAPTRLYLDPGFSVIDATLLTANDRFHLIIKDETRNPPKKYLQIADSADIRGPFKQFSAPITRLDFGSRGRPRSKSATTTSCITTLIKRSIMVRCARATLRRGRTSRRGSKCPTKARRFECGTAL
jgi:hypothetical protein